MNTIQIKSNYQNTPISFNGKGKVVQSLRNEQLEKQFIEEMRKSLKECDSFKNRTKDYTKAILITTLSCVAKMVGKVRNIFVKPKSSEEILKQLENFKKNSTLLK